MFKKIDFGLVLTGSLVAIAYHIFLYFAIMSLDYSRVWPILIMLSIIPFSSFLYLVGIRAKHFGIYTLIFILSHFSAFFICNVSLLDIRTYGLLISGLLFLDYITHKFRSLDETYRLFFPYLGGVLICGLALSIGFFNFESTKIFENYPSYNIFVVYAGLFATAYIAVGVGALAAQLQYNRFVLKRSMGSFNGD